MWIWDTKHLVHSQHVLIETIGRTRHHPLQFSCVQLFVTPWTAARQASLSITNSWSLLKLMSIESVMPSNRVIFCHPLLRPSIFPSIRVFSNESVLRIRWPKDWSFSFNISPSNEHSGLISFRKPSTLPMSKPTSKENRDSLPSHAAVNQQNPQPQRSVHLWLNLAQLLQRKSKFPLKTEYWDFPASPMVKVPRFYCKAHGFDSWSGNL